MNKEGNLIETIILLAGN